MLRRLFPILLLSLTVNACTGLKPLIPVDPSRRTTVLENCRLPFLPGKYRLVHTLETDMDDGAKGTAIGILAAEPRTRHFRTAMMTLEGWVLFDAEAGETLTLHRAVPPFNAPSFASSLTEDILLSFFPPGDQPESWGEGENGAMVCRFGCADGRLVEVIARPDGVMEIRLYGIGREVLKKVTLMRPQRPGLADALEIRNSWPPYTLRLKLLESEALDDESGPETSPNGRNHSDSRGGSEKGKRDP